MPQWSWSGGNRPGGSIGPAATPAVPATPASPSGGTPATPATPATPPIGGVGMGGGMDQGGRGMGMGWGGLSQMPGTTAISSLSPQIQSGLSDRWSRFAPTAGAAEPTDLSGYLTARTNWQNARPIADMPDRRQDMMQARWPTIGGGQPFPTNFGGYRTAMDAYRTANPGMRFDPRTGDVMSRRNRLANALEAG